MQKFVIKKEFSIKEFCYLRKFLQYMPRYYNPDIWEKRFLPSNNCRWRQSRRSTPKLTNSHEARKKANKLRRLELTLIWKRKIFFKIMKKLLDIFYPFYAFPNFLSALKLFLHFPPSCHFFFFFVSFFLNCF